jgi:hypothetical protein
MWATSALFNRGSIEIKECYDAWLEVNPALAGRVVVEFTLSRSTESPAEGRITKTKIVDSSLGHLAMEGCVVSVVEGLRFEPPDGEIEAQLPIVMSSGDPPDGE